MAIPPCTFRKGKLYSLGKRTPPILVYQTPIPLHTGQAAVVLRRESKSVNEMPAVQMALAAAF
jgi:hypothetical protein